MLAVRNCSNPSWNEMETVNRIPLSAAQLLMCTVARACWTTWADLQWRGLSGMHTHPCPGNIHSALLGADKDCRRNVVYFYLSNKKKPLISYNCNDKAAPEVIDRSCQFKTYDFKAALINFFYKEWNKWQYLMWTLTHRKWSLDSALPLSSAVLLFWGKSQNSQQPGFQQEQAAVFSKKALLNLLYAICTKLAMSWWT